MLRAEDQARATLGSHIGGRPSRLNWGGLYDLGRSHYHRTALVDERVPARQSTLGDLFNRKRVDLNRNRVFNTYKTGGDFWRAAVRDRVPHYGRGYYDDPRHRILSAGNRGSAFNQLLGNRRAAHARPSNDEYTEGEEDYEEPNYNQQVKIGTGKDRSGAARVFTAASQAAQRARETSGGKNKLSFF